jgi:hypothetical protein
MPGLFGDAAEYGRGLLAAYDKWPGLAGLLGMPSAAAQVAASNQAAQGKPLNDRGAVQAFLDSPVAMMMSTDPIRRVGGPIRAYHGSPHDFDKFDLGKIGTGEGAQAYGHGLYFAENEGVARNYRDALAGAQRVEMDGVPIWTRGQTVLGRVDLPKEQQLALDAITRFSDPKEATRFLSSRSPLGEGGGFHEARLGAIELLESGRISAPSAGRMYEVNLHADPQRFLDWDKPLSRQSPDVQGVLERFGFKAEPEKMAAYDDALLAALKADGPSPPLPKQPADPLGANIYESQKLVPGAYRDSAQATGALRDAGIPGIRYLDQGSRNIASLGEISFNASGLPIYGGTKTTLTPMGVEQTARSLYGDKAAKDVLAALRQYEANGSIPELSGRAAEFWSRLSIPQRTSNYVVFDPSIIEIMRKYGIAAPVATAATGGLLGGGEY